MIRVLRRLILVGTACLVLAATACYRPSPVPETVPATALVAPEPTIETSATSPPAEQGQPAASDAPPSPAALPSPAFAGPQAGTPTPNPTPVGHDPATGTELYTVGRGQTLGWIALRYGCSVEEIVALNGLADANSVYAGQQLLIPVSPSRTSPSLKLLPDSEMVYGPAYIHFDLAGFVVEQGGYLADYWENVEGRSLTGAEVVQLVSTRISVGPRVLLALLELQSAWVTHPTVAAETLYHPMGNYEGYAGLYRQLEWAAVRLNEGYYGWKWGDRTSVRLADGTRVATAAELNPGTAGVQNLLAYLSGTWDEWLLLTGPDGFLAAYRRLFGDPFAYAVEPLVPADLNQPELHLPWEAGHIWYLTGGPHGAWGEGGDQSALDFAPSGGHLGCMPSTEWVVAAAPGRVVRSEVGEVLLDLDGDGFAQSGWVLFYMHVDGSYRVEAGTYLERGGRIGHPSCEGGYSEATHLHLARRYNGEWMPAGRDRFPMVLSGWAAHSGKVPYDGTMTRGGELRTACECWEDDYNGLVADGGP